MDALNNRMCDLFPHKPLGWLSMCKETLVKKKKMCFKTDLQTKYGSATDLYGVYGIEQGFSNFFRPLNL